MGGSSSNLRTYERETQKATEKPKNSRGARESCVERSKFWRPVLSLKLRQPRRSLDVLGVLLVFLADVFHQFFVRPETRREADLERLRVGAGSSMVISLTSVLMSVRVQRSIVCSFSVCG